MFNPHVDEEFAEQQVLKEENKKRENRKSKYGNQHYLDYKKDHNLTWGEVPFVCHYCGIIFHRSKVKPKTLPKNCSEECRDLSFDPSVGAITSEKVLNLPWDKIKTQIISGKAAPEISENVGVCLATLHKHVRYKFGVKLQNRMKDNGKKRRLEGHQSYFSNLNK